jgi:hypothetical protein
MSPQPDLPHSTATLHSATAETNEFSAEERRVLLEIAHRAIAAKIKREKFELASPSPHLAEPRGAFTTIYLRGALRDALATSSPPNLSIARWLRPPALPPLTIRDFSLSLPKKLRSWKSTSAFFPRCKRLRPLRLRSDATAF